jgi:hypothetical protein
MAKKSPKFAFLGEKSPKLATLPGIDVLPHLLDGHNVLGLAVAKAALWYAPLYNSNNPLIIQCLSVLQL